MKNTISPLLRLDGVTVRLSAMEGPVLLLEDITLDLHQGEWLAIVGPNGSGKSTLAKVIAGLCPPTEGTVMTDVQGRESAFVQMIFQNPDTHLFGETVYDEVCFGLENRGIPGEQIRERAMAALREVGLEHKADAAVASLSGGQKQLLAAAGCLAVRPDVLLFDEATSMLDPLSRDCLLHTARRLQQSGMTIVWITQLLEELAYADRAIALENGAQVYEGSPERFFYEGPDASMCERLGFQPPFTVAVARGLLLRGLRLEPLPLTPEDLAKAVSSAQ
ncbi:ATP-binding cassette domain-containing protein [Paenibacillus filicis]|uniref:ATP-binding cassette domain-containing protein n=1 Tax=Paenibacillus gyeongsangnamensis TaxID=3388067 RepID=A0ABT4QBS3_9BACL|nr:ATP-binding cassette domain-containing protein [Paenibacillus filicis]MCZ8514207.1 ATP-binding cassette domain-containing protein [Paenibacillus filicis]